MKNQNRLITLLMMNSLLGIEDLYEILKLGFRIRKMSKSGCVRRIVH